MEQGEKRRKRPGPLPGPPMRKYNVLIEEDLAEWGKSQPGGLSALIRNLLTAERLRRERTDNRSGRK